MNSLKASFEISGSVIGKKSSIASKTVTSEPSRDQTLPSSNPIIPAPTIPNVLGTVSNESAPVLFTIFSLKHADGISIGVEPVAIIIFLVSISSYDPSIFSTLILLDETIIPFPEIASTLFDAKRPSIPPVNFETISFFLFIID